MKHLAWTLLIIGCGGDSFSANEREAASDGGLGYKPAVGVTSDGASSVTQDGAPFAGGSGGAAGLDGSGARDSGGSFDGSSSADGSSGSDGGVACTTGVTRCSGLQPQTCVSDIWLGNGAACSGAISVCLSGACVTCAPGETKCVSSTQPQTCSSTGTWQDDAVCDGTASACLDGTCASCPSGTFLHDNGLGQAFCNTVPLGAIYSPQTGQLALDACAAYETVNGGGTCNSSGCVCYETAADCACWNFIGEGLEIGYVHVGPFCACTSSVGENFQYW